MQKTIRVLAIIAAVLVGISLFLLVASMPFQRAISTQIYRYPADMAAELPLFPLIPFVTCLLEAGCVALLIICCGNKNGGIWLEILVVAVLAIVLPAINNVATQVYATVLGRFGSEKIVANSIVSVISSYCRFPADWGLVLAYITCGMSIAFKVISKKQSAVQ